MSDPIAAFRKIARPRAASRTAACLTGFALAVSAACAQQFPSKPVHIVTGFSAGGGADVSARIIGAKLSEYFGRPVIVENRPGASTAIATEHVAKAAADGHTLLLLPSSTTILSAMRPKLPYNLERDFSPIALLVVGQYVLVTHPSVPVRTAADLVRIARTQPGKLTYGSSGEGSASQLAAELFKSMAKVDILHVPYKGANEATIATATGEIDVFFASIAPLIPLQQAGKVRVLGVTGAKRTDLLPSAPTIAESGLPGYERYGWYGLIAPAGLPADVVRTLNAAVAKAGETREIREAFVKQGMETKVSTPEEFGAFIRNDIQQNARLMQAAGVKPQ